MSVAGPIPGTLDETRIEEPVPEAPTTPLASPKREKVVAKVVRGPGPTIWPRLAGKAISRLQEHQLPGDEFVSLRFQAQKNFRSLIFLPCIFLVFISDSAVLVHETGTIPDGKGGKRCMWGNEAEDMFTDKKFCPAIGGLSPIAFSVAWYGLFLITCAICYFRGRVIKSIDRSPDREKTLSPLCYFLDCTRAGYTDNHLAAWFAVMTLAFGHSVLARIISTPEGEDDIGNACLRYGDWSGHEDYCQPGGLLEPAWTVALLGTYLCFAAALMDQGTLTHTISGEENKEDESTKARGWCWALVWPFQRVVLWLTVQERPKLNISPEEVDRRKDRVWCHFLKKETSQIYQNPSHYVQGFLGMAASNS